MKRFYCTICKKVKRARSFPRAIKSLNFSSVAITDRTTVCNKHINSAGNILKTVNRLDGTK